MKTFFEKCIRGINNSIVYLDRMPLEWIGILVFICYFIPHFILKEKCVFEIVDQLDETIMSYILNARYIGSGVDVFPEMLGGISESGIQPSAVLFVILYRFFEPFTAFLLQYAIVFICGFVGMYWVVKRLTESSILSLVTAICFSFLPIQPIYGLSVLGVPLLIYAFLCLYDRKKIIFSYVLILFFGLTTHLILIGYVVLGIWALYILYMFISKKINKHSIIGFVELLITYVLVNRNLILDFLINDNYISHREEYISIGSDFYINAKYCFLYGEQHAYSYNIYLVLPIFVLIVLALCMSKNKNKKERNILFASIIIFVVLFGIAVFYSFCKTEIVADWRNSVHGFLRYFQIERIYFISPSGWYILFALAYRCWWGTLEPKYHKTHKEPKKRLIQTIINTINAPTSKTILLIIIIIPTLYIILDKSNFYDNVREIRYGSDVTKSISWEAWYSEELMKELDCAIGRDRTEYRIAHLGICPAPSLAYGFYTVDGYSNNYDIEYKHKFRLIIESELEKDENCRLYFDNWGSRCYLFNSISGTSMMISKKQNMKYSDLEIDMEKLKELGCDYIFSAGEIVDYEEMGLDFLGYYTTDTSYWGIWLYQLN